MNAEEIRIPTWQGIPYEIGDLVWIQAPRQIRNTDIKAKIWDKQRIGVIIEFLVHQLDNEANPKVVVKILIDSQLLLKSPTWIKPYNYKEIARSKDKSPNNRNWQLT